MNTMTFKDYMASVEKRCKPLPLLQHIVHMGLGVVGEYGELADSVKKATIYEKPWDFVHLKEEIGDAAWYTVGYAIKLGLTADELLGQYSAGVRDYREDGEMQNMPADIFILSLCNMASNFVTMLLPYDDQSEASYDVRGARDHVRTLVHLLGTLCARWDFDIGEVFFINDAKLEKRYGEKFSTSAALNRDLAGERAVLEGTAAPVTHDASGSIEHIGGGVAEG